MIEQTKTKPQETLEFEMNEQMETFSINHPLNLSQEQKWMLAVTNLEAIISVFDINDKNNSFSITIPVHWKSVDGEELFNKLNNLLEFRDENNIELH